MCTEANPLECHRFSMISNYLVNQKGGFDIRHIIRENNEIIDKSHQELEHLMLKTYQRKYKLQVDMFVLPTMHDVIKKAYQIKNKEI
ncbi:MAG: hypothetical protein LBD75_03970 [Candidatus Peribacteria bacterium]|jgi:hypothetical protein|nr:hypothetical protein [Candidatus Peribacteria bacterium]